jgi:hypothetical protein
VLPRGNVQRDFIDRCESPARCATDCGIVSVGLPGVATRQAPSEFPNLASPLAGLLFGRPCPSAGSLRVPVGCLSVTQRSPYSDYFGGHPSWSRRSKAGSHDGAVLRCLENALV